MVEIKFVGGVGVVVLFNSGAQHGYFHTDGVWRSTCLGPQGLTGHWTSEAAAREAVDKWLADLPEYRTVYRGRKSKIARLRKTPAGENGEAK